MLCSDYHAINTEGPLLGPLVNAMKPGILYSIFYNDVGDPSKLRGIRNLKTRKFLDGHPAKWKA